MNIVKNYLTKNDCYSSGKRIAPVGMQLHTIGTAQNTSSSLASYWNQPGVSACVHYCVDAETEGKVLQFLPDNYRSWADGNFGNGNLITVELMESDYMKYTGGANYTVTDNAKFKADITRAYNTAVQFFAQKCKEYNWNPTDKLPNGLYVVSSHDEGRRLGVSTAHVDPTHIWGKINKTMDTFRADVKAAMGGTVSSTPAPEEKHFYRVRKSWDDPKSQTGAYEILQNAKDNCPWGYSVFDENGKMVYTPTLDVNTLTAKQLSGMSEADKIKAVAPIYQQCQKDTGMLASVGLAQFCLESGYGTTDLAIEANNAHGMKCSLSGNTWSNSTWDGKSKYTKKTAEQDTNGNVYYVTADFRKYPCIKDSVYDRAAYFIGAKNGSVLRYPGINKITNYEEQIKLIKQGGYATDISYINKLTELVKRWKLDQYDLGVAPAPSPQENLYRVGTAWKNGVCENQHGAFTILANAKKDCDAAMTENKKTYRVYDTAGNVFYTAEYKPAEVYVIQAGVFSVKTNADKLAQDIKAKGVDTLVVTRDNQYVVQCGKFSVKQNADNIVEKLKRLGFNAIMKVEGEVNKGEELVAKAKEIADIMIRDKWVYSNSNNRWNWEDAGKASKKVSNCALFASHALQEVGLLNKNQSFYFKENGSVVSRQKGWERLKETCKITTYNGVPVTKIKLCTGDVVCYNGHVNIFTGYAANGVATWLDAGRRGTKNCAADSPFTNKMYDKSNMTGFKVYAVVRP